MKSISFWASRHLWPARLLLFTALVLLNIVAWFTGWALSHLQVHLPFYLAYLLLLPAAIAWMVYPKNRTVCDYFYRKRCEGVTAAVTFLLVVCMSNRQSSFAHSLVLVWSGMAAEQKPPTPILKQQNEKPHVFKKNVAQKLANYIQVIRKWYQQGPKGVKYALIVLSVLVAVGLLLLIAALSCNIACAGSGILALVVFVLGSGGVIFLTIRVIKAIQRQYRRQLQKRNNLPAQEPPSL